MRLPVKYILCFTLSSLLLAHGLSPVVCANTIVVQDNLGAFTDSDMLKLEQLLPEVNELISELEADPENYARYQSTYEKFNAALLLFENIGERSARQKHQKQLESLGSDLIEKLQSNDFRIEAYLLAEQILTMTNDQSIKNNMKNKKTILTNEISNIIHDLRTPMNAIIGFSELLSSENNDRYKTLSESCVRFMRAFEVMSAARYVLIEDTSKVGHFELTKNNTLLKEKYGTIQNTLAHLFDDLTFALTDRDPGSQQNMETMRNLMRQLSQQDLVKLIETYLARILTTSKSFDSEIKRLKKINNTEAHEIEWLAYIENGLSLFTLYLNTTFSAMLKKLNINVTVDRDYVDMSHVATFYATKFRTALEIAQDAYYRQHPTEDQHKITVNFYVPSGMPPVNINMVNLYRLFDNFLSNLIKYGGPTLKTVMVDVAFDQEENEITITYKNDGNLITTQQEATVIDENGLETQQIFLAGEKGENATFTSTGVGLGIVRQIVLEAGGAISVHTIRDESNKWLVFEITGISPYEERNNLNDVSSETASLSAA